MKQFLYILYSAFLLLCVGCTAADIALPDPDGGEKTEEGEPLSVKNLGMWMEVESRSIVTGGPGEKDKNPNPLTAVGVGVTKTSSSGTVSSYNSTIKSQLFVYNTAKTPPLWELAEGEERLLLYTEKGTVYGFAPAEKSISLAGTPRVPLMSGVRVLDKQRFVFNDGGMAVNPSTDVQWETDQDDYLYGKATAEVDRWHPEASLLMHHALAKVSFRVLEEGTAFAGCYVEKVVLKSTGGFKKSTSAKLNLSTGDLEGTMTAVDELVFTAYGDLREVGSVTADAGSPGASTVPIQAFGLVIPVSGVNVTLELTFDDGRIFTMKPSASGSGPGTFTANWQKGYNYIYNLLMQPQGIELMDIKVAAWNDGGAYDVPME